MTDFRVALKPYIATCRSVATRTANHLPGFMVEMIDSLFSQLAFRRGAYIGSTCPQKSESIDDRSRRQAFMFAVRFPPP